MKRLKAKVSHENSSKAPEVSNLRTKAEELVKIKQSVSDMQISDEDVPKLIHELKVHQIELEMQNEELIQAGATAQEFFQKYIELYDFAPLGYFTLSSAGKIIGLNLKGAQMLRKERTHLKNSSFGFFVSDDTKPVFNLFLEKVFKSNTKETCEVILSFKDTLPIYVHITGNVTNNGEQCFVIIDDITARKQIEQELIKAKERAEESDRLKSAFLANMSHEIRTPMNGILGFTELLKKPNLSGERQQKFISMIEKGGERMLSIINDLIDISKIESGLTKVTISECNLNEQIQFIYAFFKSEVESKGMQLFSQICMPTKDVIIRTDREKLYAILTNLVKNAIKYTNTGTIEFGYKFPPVSETAQGIHTKPVKLAKEPTELLFFVKDTGIGITQDQMKTIFNRFIQVDNSDKRAYQGAGLGLSISKAYVEMLGGKIWVESEIGKGSTFYFTIPFEGVSEEKKTIQNVVNGAISGDQIKDLKILIAEDDELSAILQKELVKPYCKEAKYVITGVEAIQACRDNPDFDLILMDIQMPEMNGYEATRQIRKFNKEVVIIAQTAFALTYDRELAIESGCNDYITKPLNSIQLIRMIKKYLSKK